MSPTPAVYISYTGLINPPSATPVLTRAQVWSGLEIKVTAAQDFVGAIISTDVVSTSEDQHGRKVTQREVVFKEGNRRVSERVVEFAKNKVVFHQTDGSQVQNIISQGADGDLYMTYDFEWLHSGMGEEELEEKRQSYQKMSKMAVESSIDAIREMVKSGRIK